MVTEEKTVEKEIKQGQLAQMSPEETKAYLKAVAEKFKDMDGSREYEVAIVALIDNNPWKRNVIEPIMQQLIKESETDPDLAYAAFYALCTYYRRKRHKDEYNVLIHWTRQGFKGRASYAFLELMCDKMLNPNDWRLLNVAKKLCSAEGLKENYGVKHCYAEYVAEACENDPSRVPYFVKEHMEDAFRYLDEAIRDSKEKYAKFYVTRARLNNIKAMHTGDEACFRLAQSEIEEAISKEEDTGKQNEYRIAGIRLKSEYYEKVLNNRFSDQEEEMKKQFHENNVKNLEFLSFFSAIIGLLIAGVQVALNMNFRQASTLLVALVGCLITAFGAIGFVLHSKWQRWLVNVVIVGIGITLLVLAMMYGERNVL